MESGFVAKSRQSLHRPARPKAMPPAKIVASHSTKRVSHRGTRHGSGSPPVCRCIRTHATSNLGVVQRSNLGAMRDDTCDNRRSGRFLSGLPMHGSLSRCSCRLQRHRHAQPPRAPQRLSFKTKQRQGPTHSKPNKQQVTFNHTAWKLACGRCYRALRQKSKEAFAQHSSLAQVSQLADGSVFRGPRCEVGTRGATLRDETHTTCSRTARLQRPPQHRAPATEGVQQS